MLTRITVATTLVLLLLGFLVCTITEWSNPKTLGPMDAPGKLPAGFFTGVMPRTAGFNSLDVAGMYPTSWLTTDVLMFIGGGSAGTAGGIKVTTFAVLALTPHSLDQVLSEVISAVATVGLSTGITPDLTAAGQILIALLMFAGRVGPATLFSALALRTRRRRYELPEEKVIVG